jgi:hypothetical protein
LRDARRLDMTQSIVGARVTAIVLALGLVSPLASVGAVGALAGCPPPKETARRMSSLRLTEQDWHGLSRQTILSRDETLVPIGCGGRDGLAAELRGRIIRFDLHCGETFLFREATTDGPESLEQVFVRFSAPTYREVRDAATVFEGVWLPRTGAVNDPDLAKWRSSRQRPGPVTHVVSWSTDDQPLWVVYSRIWRSLSGWTVEVRISQTFTVI